MATVSLDLKTVATVVGLVSACVSPIVSFALLEQRFEQEQQLNKEQAEEIKRLSAKVDSLERMILDLGNETACLICSAHDFDCPRC